MIDLHTHTLISDGALVPSELARRAVVKGYTALAITDHADESNVELVLKQILKVARQLNKGSELKVVPGVELTHIPPQDIPRMVKKARRLGARLVVGHGQTIVEPVAPGTNEAYIRSRVDILAHSLSNGHVVAMAKKNGVKMVLNTDAHAPGDLITDKAALDVALGAGLTRTDFRRMRENAENLVKKITR
jgi:histidinol phosphatase-like PHP family hydrolase